MLALVVLAVFGQAATFDFVNLDDLKYVKENARVTDGPTLDNLSWGLTTLYFANWHPLTWWSWQLDTAVWGSGPRGYHLTNIGLHIINVLLVQRVVWLLTGRRSGAFLIALVFAVHPLRWESVAWISERKGLLSGLFALLAVERYHAYVQSPGWRRMSVVAMCLALSLMAKAMAVTLPCVLLLLDWRPYSRWTSRGAGIRLVLEKWPLWLLVAVSGVLTFIAQKEGGAVRDLEELGLGQRVIGASWAYVVYVGQTLWPARLCVFYPIPDSRPVWQAIFTGTTLTLLTTGAFAVRRRWPGVLVGWLCFLGMLVPVIGLMQVGGQAHADRYTYLPSIPLLIAMGTLAFAAAERWLPVWPRSILVLTLLVPLIGASVGQGEVWRDRRTLWQQACRVAPCETNWWTLGIIELADRRYEPAIEAFREACRFAPEVPQNRGGLAAALDGAERWDEAERSARDALALAASADVETQARCHLILGKAAVRKGDRNAALKEFEAGLTFSQSLEIRSELAVRLLRSGWPARAVPHLQRICADDPGSPEARGNLANAFAEMGDWAAAAAEFGRAVDLAPQDRRLLSRWVTALTASGQVDAARTQANALILLDPNWPGASLRAATQMTSRTTSTRSQIEEGYWMAAAVALVFETPPAEAFDVMGLGAAGLGRFEEASRLAERAIDTARANGQSDLVKAIASRWESYRAEQRPTLP